MSKARKTTTRTATAHPDARLIALGAKLCAAMEAEDAELVRTAPFRKRWGRVLRKLDADCIRRYGENSPKWSIGRNHQIADATPAGRAYHDHNRAWKRAASVSWKLCQKVNRIQPQTVEGLGVLALASARDGYTGGPFGFDFQPQTARLILAVCAVAKFRLPARWRARLSAHVPPL